MTTEKRKLIVLAAGGTGGHMFPAQALARELLARGQRVALITDRRGGGFGPDLAEVETFQIAAAAITGGDLWRKFRGGLDLAHGYLQARGLLKRLKADVVVGFGGYASLPTVMAAAHLHLPVVLHEQNAVVGRANRMVAGKARSIATSFDEVQGISEADLQKVVVTGNPVRPAIAQLGGRPYALPGEKTRLKLLVVGGSQGARVFNNLVPEAITLLDDRLRSRLDLVQQVRGSDLEDMQETYRRVGVRATLKPFFDDIPDRLKQAHLVISRSGASTVAELAAAGRPAIMVPYPFAADDHQTGNAQALANAGGGWLMPQSALTAEALAERLASLFHNPAALARAARCASEFARRDAAVMLADMVCAAGKSNGQPGEAREEKAA
jgi:UDP-N-acetylglucosamine--N-acetylmuramyl-(pentapeptide) pyrophosphoryl-undecaprenol N-acetylglucosamine transferase